MKNIMLRISVPALAVAMIAGSAFATEGYFQNGTSTISKSVVGADVANARDALASAQNPAGILGAGNQLNVGLTVFNPVRGFTGVTAPSGGSLTPTGKIESQSEYFPVPAFGYVRQIDANSAFAVSVYGNGGMNTNYEDSVQPRTIMTPGGAMPCSGVFCAGKAGVSLNQLFVSATYARKINDTLSVGVSPMFVLQGFKAYGLQMFGSASSNAAKMTNKQTDWGKGLGIRLGAEVKLSPNLRLGLAYQPKINMSEFDEYAGLFADKGDFDVPANYTIGAAFDVSPATTLMFAYRNIAYSDVGSIGNATTVMLPFGSANGPGFGWEDVKAYKLGVSHKYSDALTIRGGVSSNNNPIGPEDVTLNILAPGVQKLHVAGGVTYDLGGGNSLDLSLTYSPESKVTGIEVSPMGPNPTHTNELYMRQIELGFTWNKKF